MVRWGMVIDLHRCVGCYACQVDCKLENATRPGIFWGRLEDREFGKYPSAKRIFLPMLCMQCRDPPCERVCPTGATKKRGDGIVFVDNTLCVGCKACMAVCPYGSRFYNDGKSGYLPEGLTPFELIGYQKHVDGVVEKCTFCAPRIDEGIGRGLKPGVDREATPSCVNTCPANARFFGDLDDPESEVSNMVASGKASQLLAELGTDPQVYYLPP